MDTADVGHASAMAAAGFDIAPTPGNDLLRARREIEAQSRDIMEILSRASREGGDIAM